MPQRPATTPRARRLDLQGLRALAVLLVALDHAGIGFLKGGYVGVDVFFVLSGFFITQVLLDARVQREHGLRAGLADFYTRRIRRIVPAACLTLVVTNIAVALTVNFLTATSIRRDSVAATFFYANFHFAAGATNYFAQALGTIPSPIQHFWSLSVEEQFYFVWPSLVLGTLALAWWRQRRHHASASRRPDSPVPRTAGVGALLVIGIVVLACFGASLAYSIIDTHTDPRAAYFSTFARVWELGLGAAIACAAPRLHTIPRPLRSLLAIAGVVMIVVAAVTFSSTTAFPGSAALLPTVGSALLVIAGLGGEEALVGRALGSVPMCYIGDRSYTFYLWHFPALIVTELAVGHPLPLTTNLLLLLGAFGLSVITYALYENPLRHARRLSGARIAVVTPALVGVAILSVVIPGALAPHGKAPAYVPPLTPAPGQPVATSLFHSKPIPAVVRAAAAADADAPVPDRLNPPLSSFEDPPATAPTGCTAVRLMVTSKLCPEGDTSAHRVLALIGDSHAGMWIAALNVAARALHYKLIPLSHSGCELDRINHNTPGFPCKAWYQWATKTIGRLHPVATIVAYRTDQYRPPNYQPPRFAPAIGWLRQVMTQVPKAILIADPPPQSTDAPECLASSGANLGRCSSWQGPYLVAQLKAIAEMAAQIGRPVIPTLQWFCDRGRCPMVINDTVTRVDTSHVSGSYSAELGPLMAPELRAALAPSGGRLAPAG